MDTSNLLYQRKLAENDPKIRNDEIIAKVQMSSIYGCLTKEEHTNPLRRYKSKSHRFEKLNLFFYCHYMYKILFIIQSTNPQRTIFFFQEFSTQIFISLITHIKTSNIIEKICTVFAVCLSKMIMFLSSLIINSNSN